jgi:2-phosphosulfolactate phosphatase
MNPAHSQAGHRVRFEWGPTGAAAVAGDADVAVVVDVLSFTTTLTIAVEHGTTVWPFPWKDERATAYAAERGATLAVGRSEARDGPGEAVSLSPAAMTRVHGVERLVLPSPNGSAICAQLAGTGAKVVAACLRNRTAVAHRLAPERDLVVAVVAAGERWPDGSLRPCAEDLWGAGAVLASLVDHEADGLSPEAWLAVAAFRAVEPALLDNLRECAGGRELAAAGFAADVDEAAHLDVSMVVPVLNAEGAFTS